ncbi:hypothetical protein CHS0354_000670 [Potamilus streckersoni]|uniref:TonB-dependent receptor plug domain-containing protein n=1 Tax=Potamilus streckersoni TaxID=2493646 RepID=A0AAE0T834_9BIVA|nr:hypothetical protein CHS0354_000670 [Potamilus streckersoni]
MKYYLLVIILFSPLLGMSQVSEIKDSTNQEKHYSVKELTVSGLSRTHARNTYKVDSSHTVGKLPLRDIENPQVYNSISKEIMKDQVVVTFSQALKNATGVSRLWESTGRGGDGAEFYTMRGFSIQPTLTNGVANISNGALDPANIELIEVIKGPSGTLFGGNLISYGGLINVITKKPFKELAGNIGYVGGNYGLSRVKADINVPITNYLFVRVNSAYHSENHFQDAGFNRSFFIGMSLKLEASENLSFFVNTEFKTGESANPPMIFLNRNSPLSFSSIDVFEANYNKSYTNNALVIKNPTFGIQVHADLKITDNITSQSILSTGSTKTDGYYHYLWDNADGNTFTRFISKRDGETTTINLQQNFSGDHTLFQTIRNRIVIGFDFLSKEIRNNSTGWVANGTVSLREMTDNGTLTTQGVDNLLIKSSEGNSIAKTEIFSVYVSDVVNLVPNLPALSAMLSLRLDHFGGRPSYWQTNEIKNQITLSPKFGLVYQPILNVFSVFANYMNGFTNIAPAEVSDVNKQNPTIKVFDPEHANQWEAGAKANLFEDRISITGSYYNITVSNRVMTDPNNPNNQIQGGEIKSQGFEINITTSPIEGLSIVTGFSKNISETTVDATDGGYLGLRPEQAGPEHLFNFWASYKFQHGILKNLGIGFGCNYASEHKTLNRSTSGTFTLPSYIVLNAGLWYHANLFDLNFKIDNFTNLKYFTGWSTCFRVIHRWLGLLSGALIFVIAVTGCLYAFQQEIQDALQSYRFIEKRNSEYALPSELVTSAKAPLPDKELHSIKYQFDNRAAEAIFYHYEPTSYFIMFMNPYTGEILHTQNMEEGFFPFVLKGHFYLWLPPEIGQPVVATITLVFFLILVCGLVLWFPKNKQSIKNKVWFQWNPITNWKRKNYDLHSIFGFYSLFIAFIFVVTGLVWGFQWFAQSYYAVLGGEKSLEYEEPFSTATQKENTNVLDHLFLKLKSETPDIHSIEVHPPTSDSTTIAISTNTEYGTYWKIDYRYFDQFDFQEKYPNTIFNRFQNATFADKLMRMNYDIHTGAIFGFGGKIFMFFMSLLIASLPVTGFLFWYGKRKSM